MTQCCKKCGCLETTHPVRGCKEFVADTPIPEENWRENIHDTVRKFLAYHFTGIPQTIIDAIDAAYVAGLDDRQKAISSHTEKLIGEVSKMRKNGISQIKMPDGYNPDRLNDVVYCAGHNITSSYNQALDDILQIMRGKTDGK